MMKGTTSPIRVEFTIANHDDTIMAEAGRLDPDQVRRIRLFGLVDTGTMRLVLPEDLADRLGLVAKGEARISHPDGSARTRRLVRGALVTIRGREGSYTAIVDPDAAEPRIGWIVLQDLDFLVDTEAGDIYPRDPNMIVSEVE